MLSSLRNTHTAVVQKSRSWMQQVVVLAADQVVLAVAEGAQADVELWDMVGAAVERKGVVQQPWEHAAVCSDKFGIGSYGRHHSKGDRLQRDEGDPVMNANSHPVAADVEEGEWKEGGFGCSHDQHESVACHFYRLTRTPWQHR